MAEEGGRADLPICHPTVRKFVVVITGRHQTENYSVGLVLSSQPGRRPRRCFFPAKHTSATRIAGLSYMAGAF